MHVHVAHAHFELADFAGRLVGNQNSYQRTGGGTLEKCLTPSRGMGSLFIGPFGTSRDVVACSRFRRMDDEATTLHFWSCCVLSLLLGLPAYAQLDHFNVYNVSGGPDGPIVQIADQFGSIVTDLGTLSHFLVPADKNDEGITDFFSHLACYDIFDPVGFAPPSVIAINQFGTQTLNLGESRTLCVPTEKLIAPGPVNLDHYRCYDATGPSIDVGVSIQDQFQQQSAIVLDPFLFCTPADKNGEVIQNPDDHLTIYHYTPPGASPGLMPILNQFLPAPAFIDVNEPFALAVPSLALNFILGDMNGDFNVTVADAGLLVEALTNRTAYDLHSFDVDPDINGDTDGSGTFDSGDLAAFNALLTPASAAGVPEPSTLLLTLFALDGVAGRRRRTSA